MATITTAHVSYQITRVVILPQGATNGKPGAIRVCATEIGANYPTNLSWRADVMFTRDDKGGWYFSSWNIGTHLDAVQQVAQAIEAGLADFIDELDIDARDAEAAASTSAVHPYREETIKRALDQGIKINDGMVANSHTLRDVAADFIKTYKGTNSFVQAVAIHGVDRGFFSIPQMRGVLNVMIAEAKIERAQAARIAAIPTIEALNAPADNTVYLDLRSTSEKQVDDAGDPPAADDAPQTTRRVPNGTYTIILDAATDEYRTIRLADAPEHFNAAPGTQIASYLNGADNDSDYIGFAFVIGTQIKLWRKFTNGANGTVQPIELALDMLINSADPISHMREYVLRSARCGVCGHKLTTPNSIRLGIGPICKAKLAAQGYTFELPTEARAILAATVSAPPAAQPKTQEERTEAARKATAALNDLFD